MNMHNPPHPGLTIREDVLPELGMSVTDAAAHLGLHRTTLSRVINGKAAISPDMALRLMQWLGVDAEQWLRLQTKYDLWQARKSYTGKVKRHIQKAV